MRRVELRPGDVFCTHGNMGAVSAFIRAAEKFWSVDDQADYGHAGIITSSEGDTFEMLWTACRGSLDAYLGQKLIIARPVKRYQSDVPVGDDWISWSLEKLIHDDEGKWYPVHRLFLHLIPPLAKYASNGNRCVCSEETAKFLGMIGARPNVFAGVNPDTLADEFVDWRNFDVIFQGIWSGQ